MLFTTDEDEKIGKTSRTILTKDAAATPDNMAQKTYVQTLLGFFCAAFSQNVRKSELE
jgi:hypothetical protein